MQYYNCLKKYIPTKTIIYKMFQKNLFKKFIIK